MDCDGAGTLGRLDLTIYVCVCFNIYLKGCTCSSGGGQGLVFDFKIWKES
jgi:hypothetical protein